MSTELSPKQQRTKKAKHARNESSGSGELAIEELHPDDMGYDADVEILRPEYEELDSDAESPPTPEPHQGSVDEELAARMKRLGRDSAMLATLRAGPERGHKRRHRDMQRGTGDWWQPRELEVQELMDNTDKPPPAKRRKSKLPRRPSALNGGREWPGSGSSSGSSDQAIPKNQNNVGPSNSPDTVSEAPTPPLRNHSEEAMDLS